LEGINHFGINVLLESHITISQSQFHEPGFTFLTRLEREGEREIEEIQKSVGSGKSGDKAGQAFESKDKDRGCMHGSKNRGES
jgi:hypothetical protein